MSYKIDWTTIKTVLYDGGDTGTNNDVSLSQSVTSFSKIRVFFRDNDNNRSSLDLWNPNGKIMNCLTAQNGITNLILKSGKWQVNGSQITFINYAEAYISTNTYVESNNRFSFITRVEGWKN